MVFASHRPANAVSTLRPAGRRGLLTGGALTLLLAGSLAFTTPALAQDDTTAEPTAAAGESTGTSVEAGTTGETTVATDAGVTDAATTDAATTDETAATDTAAAPAVASESSAAPAAGAAAPSALPNTGVGDAAEAPLALIALAAAGAVAAGSVAVGRTRTAARRA